MNISKINLYLFYINIILFLINFCLFLVMFKTTSLIISLFNLGLSIICYNTYKSIRGE